MLLLSCVEISPSELLELVTTFSTSPSLCVWWRVCCVYTLFTSHSSRQLQKETYKYGKIRNGGVMTKTQARLDDGLTEKIGVIGPASTHWRFNYSLLITFSWCSTECGSIPRSLSSLKVSAVVDRSPLVVVVPPLPPLLFLLFSVVLTVLGRLSLTPFGRPLPMIMCTTNTPSQERPSVSLSETQKIIKITDLIVLRTPPSLCTSPTGYFLCWSQTWNTWSRHASRWCSLLLLHCHLLTDDLWGLKIM
jgi:hypothetical protein